MMMVYDMNTGQVIESGCRQTRCDGSHDFDRERRVEESLQTVSPTRQARREPGMPPELASVEPDAFLRRMG